VNRPPAQPNKSLADGIDLLLALISVGEPVGVRELARRIGMETTRVQRLLGTLAYQGMAARTADRKYEAGPGIHVLSAMSLAGSGLLRRGLPHLRKLQGAAPIVAMGVLWRDEMCYLYHGSGQAEDDQALGRMTHFPAWRSGLGVSLLAEQDAAYLERHILPALDDPRRERLLTLLDQTRSRGYAVVPQERSATVTVGKVVGAPAYAAIGLSGPHLDQRADLEDLVARIAAAAAAIDAG